jgi:hypothetical protein
VWVSDLQCAAGHGFEGFFPSREDFEQQRERGLVSCPHCGSSEVSPRLNAPRLNLGAEPAPSPRELVAQLKAGSEDIGHRFAEEVRAIHEGRARERRVHGQASGEEFLGLLEDGIPVLPLPDLEPAH